MVYNISRYTDPDDDHYLVYSGTIDKIAITDMSNYVNFTGVLVVRGRRTFGDWLKKGTVVFKVEDRGDNETFGPFHYYELCGATAEDAWIENCQSYMWFPNNGRNVMKDMVEKQTARTFKEKIRG